MRISLIYQCFRTGASLHLNYMYNNNGSWKYHFNQYELNVNIYQCFRTGASQSIHNMCGSRNFYQGGGGGGGGVQTRRQENSLDSFCLFCVVLNLLTEGFQWFYFRGVFHFPGVLSFSRGGGGGGPNVNFYRNPYITCDFLSPLWISACIITFICPVHSC